eukprot:gene20766-22789_t
MSKRKARYATFHDKKVTQDDKLEPRDYVYMFLPRLTRTKLTKKWNGPFQVIRSAHPFYSIEVQTDKGNITKTVTRDKLKRVRHPTTLTEIKLPSTEESEAEPKPEAAEEITETSDSEDEEVTERELHPPYNLRSRRNIVPHNDELLSFVVVFR